MDGFKQKPKVSSKIVQRSVGACYLFEENKGLEIKKEVFFINGKRISTNRLVKICNPIISLIKNSELRLTTHQNIKGLVCAPLEKKSYFKEWMEGKR